MARSDSMFLTAAVPVLSVTGVALADGHLPRFCSVSQSDYLSRSRWRAPALTAWMLLAFTLSWMAPQLAARRATPEVRAALGSIPALLVLQVGLEGSVGTRTDRGHPVIGSVFSLWRIAQAARVARVCGDDPGQRLLCRVQQVFWTTNVVMLALTMRGRSPRPTRDRWAGALSFRGSARRSRVTMPTIRGK